MDNEIIENEIEEKLTKLLNKGLLWSRFYATYPQTASSVEEAMKEIAIWAYDKGREEKYEAN